MKLKNISIGDFIEAKNKHGGDVGFDVLEIGKSYEVLGFNEGNEGNDLTVIISVPNHKVFSDGFYVCHECFIKPQRDIAEELLEVDLATTPNDFKEGDLVFELDFANGIKLANLKKAGRLASEDYDFQTRYGFNYLKDGRAYPIFSIPHLIHATTENRKALITLYGEKAVPQLPSEAGLRGNL